MQNLKQNNKSVWFAGRCNAFSNGIIMFGEQHDPGFKRFNSYMQQS